MHNANSKSVYICLEGLKGAGKTTLLHYLVSRLTENNIDFSTVSPTRSSGDNHLIERIFKKFPSLKEKRFPRIFLYAHRSNYAAKVADWNKPLILGERSLTTSYATKWSSSLFLTWLNIKVINILENKIKTPDYVIYIDVPHDILKNRIENRDKERDMDDSVSRLKQMENAYVQMMDNCKVQRISSIKWLTVSGVEEPEIVGEKIFNLITQLSDIENKKESLKGKKNLA